jgi:superfamily II DNA or RNA helicase
MSPNVTLRPYQAEAKAAVKQRAREGIRRPVVVLPTGTGKTVLFASLAEEARAAGHDVLIIAHRDELLQQAADKLINVAPHLADEIGFCAGNRQEWDKHVVIASVQTLSRERRLRRILLGRGYPFPDDPPGLAVEGHRPFRLIIVDEAHHVPAASYMYVLEALGCFEEDGPITLGVTATSQRADSADLTDAFQEVVYHRDILSMMQAGYLCDLTGVSVRLAEFRTDKLHVRRGDFVAEEASQALEDADAPEHTVEAWLKHAVDDEHPDGRKTLLFTPTVRMADLMAEEFRARGIAAVNASRVASESTEARRDLLARFASGEVKVLTNASLLTEGYDEPTIECIVIARPTKSQPFYVQMVGRGTRIAPGKTDCLVLDVVGVTDRFDLITLPKLFGLDQGAARASACETCGHLRIHHHDGAGQCTKRGCRCEEYAVRESDEDKPLSVMDVIEEQAREGYIVAKRVELFKRADLAWAQASPTLWTLPVNDDMVTVRLADGTGRWNVYLLPRYGDQQMIAEGLEQGYAMGSAEDYARLHIEQNGLGAKLVDKNAKWRGKPATPGQVEALRKWRYKGDVTTLTSGEASEILSGLIARARSRG